MTTHIPNFDYTENKLKGILKKESNRINIEIRQKLPGTKIGQSFHVEIPGYYVIGIEREQGMNILNTRPFMTHILSSYAHELDIVYPQVVNLLLKKNKQLDYDADRKILLILDTRYRLMSNDRVIQSALNRFVSENARKEIENIDEIFICHATKLFTKAYPIGC